MADAPENLQVIKTEQLSPASPDKSKNTIKERLNLHVKRRQQHLSPQGYTAAAEQNMDNDRAAYEDKQKEIPKTRRPYTKKTEKTNAADNTATVRKRNKTKQIGQTNVMPTSSPAMQNDCNGGDDEGEGGLEMDTKPTHMRSPDVLSMVLSAKKQALMRDPEVQEFLTKMLNAIKS